MKLAELNRTLVTLTDMHCCMICTFAPSHSQSQTEYINYYMIHVHILSYVLQNHLHDVLCPMMFMRHIFLNYFMILTYTLEFK